MKALNLAAWLTPDRRDVALVGVLAFISAVIASSILLENEDVEYKLWAIKAWAAGEFPNLIPNHHNLRWAINFPAVAWVFLFGDAPQGQLTLNFLFYAASTAGIYSLARAMMGKLAALFALALWFLNPILYWLPSNLMPELYSVFYLVLGLNLLHAAYKRDSLWFYAGAMLAFFALYGAKETNLFFMPGLGLYELFRRRWDRIAVMAGVMGGAFLVETLLMNWAMLADGYWLGRIEALANGKHVGEMRTIFSQSEPIDILRRWWFLGETNLDRLEYVSKLIYLAFFAACFCLGWRAIKSRAAPPKEANEETLAAMVALGASFAFFTTIFVISLNPLLLGQPLVDRYLWVLLAPAVLVLAALSERIAFKNTLVADIAKRLTAIPSLFLIVILVFVGTASRMGVDWALVNIRRDGFARPYNYNEVNAFYRQSITEPLQEGCIVVFASSRAAWSGLIYAFPYGVIGEPERLYAREIDGLPVQGGAVVRAWALDAADWPDLVGRLYARPHEFEAHAVRLVGANVPTCARVVYVGDVDLHPRDQEVTPSSGRSAQPPPL